jgi:hypothetical protein
LRTLLVAEREVFQQAQLVIMSDLFHQLEHHPA